LGSDDDISNSFAGGATSTLSPSFTSVVRLNEPISVALLVIVAQGVSAVLTSRRGHRDVRSGRESGQFLAGRVAKLKHENVIGDLAFLRDNKLQSWAVRRVGHYALTPLTIDIILVL
jgi:hypothetical protein